MVRHAQLANAFMFNTDGADHCQWLNITPCQKQVDLVLHAIIIG